VSTSTALLAATVALSLGATVASQDRPKIIPPQLVERPQVAFDAQRHAATDEERAEIERLVAELTAIDQPDFGLSRTFSGVQFAPLADTQSVSSGVLGVDHGVITTSAVRRLVELGPKALPALLAALDDATPSQLEIVHEGHFGAMWYAREVPTNSRNPFEQVALGEFDWLAESTELGDHEKRTRIDHYTVTRGDIAFVVLGQIVGREYEAVRYQPSACIVVNSPVRAPELAPALRRIWTSDDPARRVFDSLLFDYCTRGGQDDRGGPFDHQYPATLRLAYYFPEESRSFLVQRLDSLDVDQVPWNSPGFSAAWQKDDEANGCSAAQFIEVLADSRDAAVIDAVGRAIQRTNSHIVARAALKPAFAKAKPEILSAKIAEYLAIKPHADSGPFGTQFDMLQATLRFFPEQAQGCFEAWLAHGTLDCRRAVVHALARADQRVDWAVPMLMPLLDKKTDTGWEYGPHHDRRPILLCDEAAAALAVHLEGATYVRAGNRKELDRQIENLRRLVEGLPPIPGPQPPAPFDFTALARCSPVTSVDVVDRELRPLLADSDRHTLRALEDVELEGQGWSVEITTLDVESAAATSVLLPPWKDRECQILRPMGVDRIACYDGQGDGAIELFDAHTAQRVGRVATPFRRNLPDDDPLRVYGSTDMVLADGGRAALAVTPDGALHSVDLTTGEHEIVWRAKEDDASYWLVPVEGTARVLLDRTFEEVLHVWDHSARNMNVLRRVPGYGWQAAWGRYATHQMNYWELWDLDTRKQIPLELPPGSKPEEIVCDAAGLHAFVRVESGAVYAFDLPSGQPSAILDSIAPAQVIELDASADGRWLFVSELWRQGSEGPALPMRVSVFDVGDL
jgi:hypothetical protein